VVCGDGAVALLRLQREGKAAQDAQSFLNGWPLAPGTVLGGEG
jgi:methionyl-tRNA formyltransferase